MSEIPEGLKEWLETYSNIDGQHPGAAAEAAVKAQTHYIEHPAWDHFGTIWHDGEQFVERVMIYHREQPLVYGATLKAVFDSVNERHGEK